MAMPKPRLKSNKTGQEQHAAAADAGTDGRGRVSRRMTRRRRRSRASGERKGGSGSLASSQGQGSSHFSGAQHSRVLVGCGAAVFRGSARGKACPDS